MNITETVKAIALKHNFLLNTKDQNKNRK